MQKRMDLHELAVSDLKTVVRTMAEDIYAHERDYQQFKSRMTDSQFAISLITSRMVTANKIDWKQLLIGKEGK